MNEYALSRRAFIRGATGAAAAAGASGTAAAQEGTETSTEAGTGTGTGTGTDTSGGSTETSGGGGGGGPTKEVLVGPNQSLVFEPKSLTVAKGTTVRWVWKSDTHNIVVESQPEGADWKGTPGGPGKVYDTGYEYTHTFETTGTYDYYCDPHRSAGMVGSIEVVEELSTPAPSGPAVPDSAKTLGIATLFAMLATLGLAFVFLKYGGDRPNEVEE